SHNLIKDPPFNRLDLIVCRNLLMYFNDSLQQKVLTMLNFSLRKERFLFLGGSQYKDQVNNIFHAVAKTRNIFQAVFNPNLFQSSEYLNFRKGMMERAVAPLEKRKGQSRQQKDTSELVNEMLIGEFVGACILINEKYELLKHYGHASRYLRVPNEPRNWNLIKMVSLDTGAAIRSGVKEAIRAKRSVYYSKINFGQDDQPITADMTIKPHFVHDDQPPIIFLLLHKETSTLPGTADHGPLSKPQEQRIIQLEQELKITRENLQATIEELQTANEELMGTNEELQTMNEEMQSVNEELYTINSEYQSTIARLTEANVDLDNVMQQSGIGIIFLDQELCIRRFTEAATTEFNITNLDLGRPIQHFSSNLMDDDLAEAIEQVNQSREPMRWETSTQQGKWYLVEILPYQSVEEREEGVLLSFVDISSLKGNNQARLTAEKSQKLRAQLRTEKEHIKQLSQHIQLYQNVFDLDEDIHIVFDAEGIRKLDKHQVDWLDEEELIDVQQQLIPSLFSHSGLEIENEMILTTGEHPHEKEVRVLVSGCDDGSTLAVIKNHHEIQAIRRDLKKTQARFWDLVEQIPEVSIAFFDQELRYQEAYGEMADRFHVGRSVKDMFPAIEFPHIIKMHRQAMNGVPCQGDISIAQEHFLLRILPLTDHRNEIYAGMIVMQKVSDLRHLTNELESRLKEMEYFAYAVSHDLKSPLRSIASFAQLLKRRYYDSLDEEANEFIDFIVSNVESMRDLINGLLGFSLVGSEDQQVKDLDISTLIGRVQQQLNSSIKDEQVQINVGEMPMIKCHDVLIQQVFQNLIENAIKYNESEIKQIDIQAREGDSSWIFSIADNGIGIPEKYHDQIFAIFKHLNNRRKYKGTGIGLALCKKIVDRLGGRIWVESEEGKGSTFSFELPNRCWYIH
ncbi:MAG: ATP-binding protein, partial [Bacteroidota bacterium]